MNNKIAFALTFALVVFSSQPAPAQPYHYEYGNSRVVMQNQTGLYMPSSTYIGAGTISRSAQGKSAGVGGALPAVNMGSHVRTPGDNLYNNDGTDRQGNGALIYQDQEKAMAYAQWLKVQKQIARERFFERQQMEAVQQPRGHFYLPGSNGATAGYDSVLTPSVMFRGNGAATYQDGRAGSVRSSF